MLRIRTARGLWTALGLAGCGLALALLLSSPASAQVAALVTGEPITAVDINQRIKLAETLEHKKMTRQEALDDLINQKIKLQTARRMNIEVTDQQIDTAISNMVGGRKPDMLYDMLAKNGLDRGRFRTRVRAEISWRQVIEQVSPGSFQIRDADLVAILNAHGEKPQARGIQYTLQPIIFVVARKAPESVKSARLKEAEAFRNRVQGCEEAATQARAIPETVIKDPITKFSLDLGTQYRKLLDSTPDGKMTPVEVTSAGMEVVVICKRQEVVADVSSRREIRQELMTRRVSEFEKDYLARLRKQTVIDIR